MRLVRMQSNPGFASQELKAVLFEVQHALVTHSGELLAHGAPVHGQKVRQLLSIEGNDNLCAALQLCLFGQVGNELFPGGALETWSSLCIRRLFFSDMEKTRF